jgi:hypothetical protein
MKRKPRCPWIRKKYQLFFSLWFTMDNLKKCLNTTSVGGMQTEFKVDNEKASPSLWLQIIT